MERSKDDIAKLVSQGQATYANKNQRLGEDSDVTFDRSFDPLYPEYASPLISVSYLVSSFIAGAILSALFIIFLI